jgi:hypothetical protein
MLIEPWSHGRGYGVSMDISVSSIKNITWALYKAFNITVAEYYKLAPYMGNIIF